jgi:hypothetical protein
MPIRARITELKAYALRSRARMDSLVVEVERSLDVIEARLLTLTLIRKARPEWKRRAPHHG